MLVGDPVTVIEKGKCSGVFETSKQDGMADHLFTIEKFMGAISKKWLPNRVVAEVSVFTQCSIIISQQVEEA